MRRLERRGEEARCLCLPLLVVLVLLLLRLVLPMLLLLLVLRLMQLDKVMLDLDGRCVRVLEAIRVRRLSRAFHGCRAVRGHPDSGLEACV